MRRLSCSNRALLHTDPNSHTLCSESAREDMGARVRTKATVRVSQWVSLFISSVLTVQPFIVCHACSVFHIHRHHHCVSIRVSASTWESIYMAGLRDQNTIHIAAPRFVIAEKFIGLCKSNSYGFVRWVDGSRQAVAYSNWSRHTYVSSFFFEFVFPLHFILLWRFNFQIIFFSSIVAIGHC